MKRITKLLASHSLKSLMAKKNKRSQQKNKCLKPEKDPSTVKRLLEDPPRKKRYLQPLENPPTESYGDDEKMETEEEGEKYLGKNLPASAFIIVAAERHDSDSYSETELEKKICGSVVVAKMNDDKMVSTDTKKKYFQRILSDDDKIVLLQGMVDFQNDKGTISYDDMTGFIDTVKNIISFQANSRQFTTKIRRLKDKFVQKRNKGVDENSLANVEIYEI
ncbi:DNA-binding storekeeper protein-related transcriptional regulator [Arabidopsis thaliana]|uniref:Probable transcription factor At1g55950 n=1 Tax=Arabidopsis thaliana TaxID=3702 RepID=STKLC_ARATH|nr:DNA-binding storekeeper protein-related transcriptional regulator [Arabidopsis thaliana]Q9LG15.2 RecName: Full=Probable transcription factor At1g55950; AltName: Full=Storekeeper-like protein At1g55950 [Arabidopsis thaliana]AEE33324.2 DNA-binding storekeeper protein-related transcriptional regulator [Arabidopsis thaliana]|eukprot:NP_175991.2 DNA-binding storekeeper protein-related transcriptional regulator [Arabidopsis thaliana]